MKMKHPWYHATQKIRKKANSTYLRMKLEMARRTRKEAILEYGAFLCLLFFLIVFLLVLVKVRTDAIALGYQIALLQKQERKKQKEIHALQQEYTELHSTENLLKINQNFQLLPPIEWKLP